MQLHAPEGREEGGEGVSRVEWTMDANIFSSATKA